MRAEPVVLDHQEQRRLAIERLLDGGEDVHVGLGPWAGPLCQQVAEHDHEQPGIGQGAALHPRRDPTDRPGRQCRLRLVCRRIVRGHFSVAFDHAVDPGVVLAILIERGGCPPFGAGGRSVDPEAAVAAGLRDSRRAVLARPRPALVAAAAAVLGAISSVLAMQTSAGSRQHRGTLPPIYGRSAPCVS